MPLEPTAVESWLREHGWHQDADADWRKAVNCEEFCQGLLVNELHATSALQACRIEQEQRTKEGTYFFAWHPTQNLYTPTLAGQYKG